MANKMRLGGDCITYRNTATYGSPTWNAIDNIEDVSLGLTKTSGEFKTRGRKWVLKKGAKIEGTLDVKLVYDPGDDDFSVLRDAFLNGTVIEYAIMDGPIATAGTQGLRASMEVMEFPLDEALEAGMTVAVKLAVAISDNDPTWPVSP